MKKSLLKIFGNCESSQDIENVVEYYLDLGNSRRVIYCYKLFQNSQRCHIVKIKHQLLEYGSFIQFNCKEGNIRKNEFPLNGLGKSKLKKKIERYIYNFYR